MCLLKHHTPDSRVRITSAAVVNLNMDVVNLVLTENNGSNNRNKINRNKNIKKPSSRYVLVFYGSLCVCANSIQSLYMWCATAPAATPGNKGVLL